MTRSLRRTLAVRFAATMGAGLAAVSLAVFWGTTRIMEQQLDQALVAGAFQSGELFVRVPDAPRVEPLLEADPDAYEHRVNRYVVLRDGDGRVLRAEPRSAADLPLDSAALRRALQGRPASATGAWHGRSVRSIYCALQRDGIAGDQVIQVAASLHPLRAVQRDLIVALVCIVLVGSAATLVGAWHFTGSAVRPVAEITEQATRIEAGTLDQRIAAHADTDEYRGLVAVLNRMLERLERGFQSQRRLTADVSHELRTPLTALRGEIEVALRAGRSPGEYQRVLHSALEEVERLSAMSEDLLLITRAESHLLQLRRVPTDPNALVRRALAALRRGIEDKALTVEERLDAAAQPVALDQQLVKRLVEHLLDNAVKFTPTGGRIVVATEAAVPADRGVRLAVENSGPGIAAEDLPHVFEPFYRADQARSRGTGTGLGLALVAAVTRLHGGAVRALSPNGQGARFEVDLVAPNSH